MADGRTAAALGRVAALIAAAAVCLWAGPLRAAEGETHEKAAAQCLRDLEACFTKQDFVRAYLAVKRLKGPLHDTKAARDASARVDEVAERVAARLAARKAADDRKYGIVPPSKIGCVRLAATE